MKISIADGIQIVKAVRKYNSSPWVFSNDEYSKEDIKAFIEIAKKEGVQCVLETIRRQDIYLFHKEEAVCGCI